MSWIDNLDKLKDVIDIQCSDGNWNYDPYMHGMANGLICALAILEDKEPKYKEAPSGWLSELVHQNSDSKPALAPALAPCLHIVPSGDK